MRQLRDVHQGVLARQNLDEGTEAENPDDLAVVDLARLDLLGQRPDLIGRDLGAVLIRGHDEDGAVVLNVDAGAAFFLDLADRLATGANDEANLLLVDDDLVHARRMLGQLLAGLADAVQHHVHDLKPGVARLL